MGILVDKVRIKGFRGIKNSEVDLGLVTVLTGMNNTGKTTFLKALQIALGNRAFISQDDFHITDEETISEIVIDIRIVPINNDEAIGPVFESDWEILFGEDRIKQDSLGNSSVPLRTIVTFDSIKNNFKTKQSILSDWPPFEDDSKFWYEQDKGTEKIVSYDELPFFYLDAQRDILEDMKLRNSYLGRMLSKIEYSDEEVKKIEGQIKELNESAVSSSTILKNIRTTLKELDSAMDSSSDGIEITPFTKKLRDLNKGLSIYYADSKDSFSMEYHGMGTRSWSSLLTLKSFIGMLKVNADKQGEVFFPMLAIEEPEAHLHPNAQKKLYKQIASIPGQKIISTHSTYIAASAELNQIRSLYKDKNEIKFGKIQTGDFDDEGLRKIKRQVVRSRGEIFFAKVLLLFEGETEEQALPIFAEKHFGKSPIELGIDFIGVGGSGNYLPFIRVAEALQIPWFILSDGEAITQQTVKKAVEKLYSRDVDLASMDNIVFLKNGNDFERSIIEEGYLDEIKLALETLYDVNFLERHIRTTNGALKKKIKSGTNCESCTQPIMTDVFRDYSGDDGFKEALYDCMTKEKTSFGPVISAVISESSKGIPEQIRLVFDRIDATVFKLVE